MVEHLPDPRAMLKTLASKLAKKERMIIEIPGSEDALLTLYDSAAFQRFTYWSQHLFLFNTETLRMLVAQAGLRMISIQQRQRYTLSNHLYWLSQGKPLAGIRNSFLDNQELKSAYSSALAAMGKCETIIAYLEKGPT